MKLHKAKHVLPITSAPIDDGAVAVNGEVIEAAGKFSDLAAKFNDAEIIDHGDSAIIPGFVNCHSHLEITAMRGMLDDVEDDFRSWLLKLNSIRAEMTDDAIADAAYLGALEGAAAGITCFGDIGRMGIAGMSALKRAGLRGVLYQETEFSPDNRTADDDLKKLLDKFESLQKVATDLVSVGLSPHSPYTVGSELFQKIAQISIIYKVPLSIHAAESANEDDLLIRGEGFFTDFYEKMGVEWNSPHCSTIDYLNRLGVLAARPLLGHCVRVSDDDIDRIASTGSAIAHCPRSNAKFGHGAAPFEKFLDANIAVGLGSDSVASNNSCDLIEESRFAALTARNRADSKRFIDAAEVLYTATLGGARAMRLDDKIGSLDKGKFADMAIISLDTPANRPHGEITSAIVFSASGRDIRETIVAGKTVYRADAD